MASPLPSPTQDKQPTNNSPTHDEHQAPTTAEQSEEQPPEKESQENPLPLSEPSQTLTLSVSESLDNDPNQSDMEASHPTAFSATSAFTRRGGGSLKRNNSKRFAAAKIKKLQKKLETLNENLNPIPFKPARDLNFGAHEELLKRLGLWDFVNIKFDTNLRADLVSQLIASYDQQQRGSYVNEARIRVSRADLGRALKFPAKKDKVSASEEEVKKESEEEIAFVGELVSNWMLLHEDTWMMPSDIHNWTKTIKEGSLERVDWAGLIWSMVEKELSAAPNLGNCYYASHLQCLIKYQKENLLKEEESIQVEEDIVEEDVVEEVVKTSEELHVVTELKEDSIELSLGGLDNDLKDSTVDVSGKGEEDLVQEKDKEVVEQGEEWFKTSMDESFLQHCSVAKADDLECEEETKLQQEEEQEDVAMNEEAEEEQGVEMEDVEEMDFDRSPKEDDDILNGVDSENLLASMELNDNLTSGDFLAARVDIETNNHHGSSSLYGNGNGYKRDIGRLDDDEDGDIPHHAFDKRIRRDIGRLDDDEDGDIPHHAFDKRIQRDIGRLDDDEDGDIPHHAFDKRIRRDIGRLDDDEDGDIPHHAFDKRIRSDEQQQQYEVGKVVASETEVDYEQMQYLINKTRASHMEKDRALQEASMNYQQLLNEVQARDDMIQHLHRISYEEQRKKDMEICKLERELHMMGDLLEGYRKALKETHKSFAEYRAKCPLPEKPLYKDSGLGGLVLTAAEVEKLRKEEEERLNHLCIEKKVKEFEEEWVGKFQEHEERIVLLGGRLLDTETSFDLLKEMHVSVRPV